MSKKFYRVQLKYIKRPKQIGNRSRRVTNFDETNTLANSHEPSSDTRQGLVNKTDSSKSLNQIELSDDSPKQIHHSPASLPTNSTKYNDDQEAVHRSPKEHPKEFRLDKNKSSSTVNQSPSNGTAHSLLHVGQSLPKWLLVIIILSLLVALAALGIGIYNLVISLRTSSTATSTTVILRWKTNGVTVAGNGISGTGANQLTSPIGLVIDSENSLYIADLNNSRVQKWAKYAWTGRTIAGQSSGASGSNSASLNTVGGIAIDDGKNLYVVDTFNCRVQYWLSGASTGTTVAGNGTCGSANNQLSYPYSLTRDSATGTLYIADTNNQRIMAYTVGATTGTLFAGGNGRGRNTNQLDYPIGLYYDSATASLTIANAGANNIVRWYSGASSWTLLAGSASGTIGATSTLLFYPVGVTFDQYGNMYVADTYNHRIQFFPAGQTTGVTIAGVASTPGSNATLLNFPYTVLLDSDLNLYVGDGNNNRVQKFERY